MRFVFKQLVKQLVYNKVFVVLLFILAMLTSLSFYFVMFSVDGNISALSKLSGLNESQLLLRDALNSNTTLAYAFFTALIILTVFVFIMFFYRFFRSNKRQIGCIKSLGFRDNALCSCFVIFTAILSVIGTLSGLLGGYFLSDVLMDAYEKTYSVTGLVKGLSVQNLVVGLMISTAVFCAASFFCYSFVGGKEPGVLITGISNQTRFTAGLKAANKISSLIPVKNKFPLRIALRKPFVLLLIIVAVMSFNIFIILGRSLHISSQKVFNSQIIGHNYEYDTSYTEYKTDLLPEKVAIAYLDCPAKLFTGSFDIEHTVIGLYDLNDVYELQNSNGSLLSMLEAGTVYINPGLNEIYGVNIGDDLIVEINGDEYIFTVVDIAANAKSTGLYINANELSEILEIPVGAYNGVLSMETMPGGITITRTQQIDRLDRDAVSNEISAVINQVSGVIVGIILILLALYLSFQDNTSDILILHMMGFRINAIRKMLIDIYLPIIWVAFLITLAPSIYFAKWYQKSLSISINDYMPFGTSIFVILFAFLLLSMIYWLVQVMFGHGLKRVIAKEEISEFIYAE